MRNSGLRNDAKVREWLGQIEGYIRFLEKLPTVATPLVGSAEAWRTGMRAHYLALLARLFENVPPGAEKHVKGLQSRLRRV